MSVETWQTWCPNCGGLRAGSREMPNHLLHFLVTFMTCGLWIIPWTILMLWAIIQPYRCTVCGTAGQNS